MSEPALCEMCSDLAVAEVSSDRMPPVLMCDRHAANASVELDAEVNEL